jgi:hypothetical protein
MLRSFTLSCATIAFVALPTALAAQAPQGPPPRPAAKYEVDVEKDVQVAMRDGVKIGTDVYRPKGVAGPLPTLMMRTPYNKVQQGGPNGIPRFFAGQGYAVVVQDVRGKFSSEGTFKVYEGETTDWSDAFSWVAKQPWSTGKIGTVGCSYLGEGQIIAAQSRHPNHVTAIAQAAGGNLGRYGDHRSFWGSTEGGTVSLSINFGWMPVYASIDKGARPLPKVEMASFLKTLPLIDMTDRGGSPSWDWRNFLERSPDDPWWDARGYLTGSDSVAVSALHVSSWFDMAAQALAEDEIFRKNGTTDRARTGQYAIISPTTHCASERASANTRSGELEVGDARFDYWNTYVKWFDYWLKGDKNDVLSMPKYQYFVIGRNEWHHSDVWPPANAHETTFYLASGGRANSSAGDGALLPDAPKTATATKPDTFTYDPGNPVPSRGGSICCTGNPKDQPGSYNQADIETRPDVLVYTGPALTEGLEITGPMKAMIYLSSDAKDTDVTVKLLDVFPDGRVMNIQEGIMRARYRAGFGKPTMMTAGTVYEVPVELNATSWYLPPGHRLRAEVSSSNFPRFDRNLNTGGKNYDETTWAVAHNTVMHTAAYPSRMVLSVVR